MRQLTTVALRIFLEKRKTRMLAGILERIDENLVFTYDDNYFKAKHVIPLGPEFPLTQQQFISKTLFPSLEDRIPSSRNPAYPEYCYAMGIDPAEKDPIVLLSTIGRRGPSSFVFHPIYDRAVSPEDVIKFRELLEFTTREFAAVFEFSQSSINALEKNRLLGSEVLKRLEIILHYPNVALDFLRINGGYLIHEKWVKATNTLISLQTD